VGSEQAKMGCANGSGVGAVESLGDEGGRYKL